MSGSESGVVLPLDESNNAVSAPLTLNSQVLGPEEATITVFEKEENSGPTWSRFTKVFDPEKTEFGIINGNLNTKMKTMRTYSTISERNAYQSQHQHIIFKKCHFGVEEKQDIGETLSHFTNYGASVKSIAFRDCSFDSLSICQRVLNLSHNLKALNIYNCSTLLECLKTGPGIDEFLDMFRRLQRLEIVNEDKTKESFMVVYEMLSKSYSVESAWIQGKYNCPPIILSTYLESMENLKDISEFYFDLSEVEEFTPIFDKPDFLLTRATLDGTAFSPTTDVEVVEQITNFFSRQTKLESVEFRKTFPFKEDSEFIKKFPTGIKSLKFTSLEQCDEAGLTQLVLQSRELETLSFVNTELYEQSLILEQYFLKQQKCLKSLTISMTGLADPYETLNTEWTFIFKLPVYAPELTKLDLSGFSETLYLAVNSMMPIFKLRNLKVLKLSFLDIVDDFTLLLDLVNEPEVHKTRCLRDSAEPFDKCIAHHAVDRFWSILSLQNLEVLALDHTKLGNQTLAMMSRFMPKLTKLDISHTRVNYLGLRYALGRKSFTALHVVGCYVNIDSNEDLKEKVSEIEEFRYFESADMEPSQYFHM